MLGTDLVDNNSRKLLIKIYLTERYATVPVFYRSIGGSGKQQLEPKSTRRIASNVSSRTGSVSK